MNHDAQVRRMEGFPEVLSALVKMVANTEDARRLFQLAQRDGDEFSVEYAGVWAG